MCCLKRFQRVSLGLISVEYWYYPKCIKNELCLFEELFLTKCLLNEGCDLKDTHIKRAS